MVQLDYHTPVIINKQERPRAQLVDSSEPLRFVSVTNTDLAHGVFREKPLKFIFHRSLVTLVKRSRGECRGSPSKELGHPLEPQPVNP